LLLSAFLAACSFDAAVNLGGPAPDADPNVPDANPAIPDADPSAPDADLCGWDFEPALFSPCDVPTFGAALSIPSNEERYRYNTDVGELTGLGDNVVKPLSTVENGMRVIWLESFDLLQGARLRVVGSLPLRIVSNSTINIAGELQVNSYRGDDGLVRGPGSNAATCVAAGNGQACGGHGASGGGGGGFYGNGGPAGVGGVGKSCGGGVTSRPGGVGGQGSIVPPTVLRGGCPGGNGAAAEDGGTPVGGPGGGALMLTARTSITIDGGINAGGAGGRGCYDGNRAGGGGGGSGGMIILESVTLNLDANGVLAANGGGGGGGCDRGETQNGGDGRLAAAVAAGGTGRAVGGPGGYLNNNNGVVGESDDRGSGGGGGGVGFIIFNAKEVMEEQGFVSSPEPR
jgi:hypothetical protein